MLIEPIFTQMNKRFIFTDDCAGFISARVIAMVINEAYFALDEHVSTKEEMDIAMKLGTNYPSGPFEWADKIGLNNILTLLEALEATDARYHPAPGLKSAASA